MCDCAVCQLVPDIESKDSLRAEAMRKHNPEDSYHLELALKEASEKKEEDLSNVLQYMPDTSTETLFSLAIEHLHKAICKRQTIKTRMTSLNNSGLLFKYLIDRGCLNSQLEFEAIKYLVSSINDTDRSIVSSGFELMGDYYRIKLLIARWSNSDHDKKILLAVQSICCYSQIRSKESKKIRSMITLLTRELLYEGKGKDATQLLSQEPHISSSLNIRALIENNAVLDKIITLAKILDKLSKFYQKNGQLDLHETYKAATATIFTDYIDTFNEDIKTEIAYKKVIKKLFSSYVKLLRSAIERDKSNPARTLEVSLSYFFLAPYIKEYEVDLAPEQSTDWIDAMDDALYCYCGIEASFLAYYPDGKLKVHGLIDFFNTPILDNTLDQIGIIAGKLGSQYLQVAMNIKSLDANAIDAMLEYLNKAHKCFLTIIKSCKNDVVLYQGMHDLWYTLRLLIKNISHSHSAELLSRMIVLSTFYHSVTTTPLENDELNDFYSYCFGMLVKNGMGFDGLDKKIDHNLKNIHPDQALKYFKIPERFESITVWELHSLRERVEAALDNTAKYSQHDEIALSKVIQQCSTLHNSLFRYRIPCINNENALLIPNLLFRIACLWVKLSETKKSISYLERSIECCAKANDILESHKSTYGDNSLNTNNYNSLSTEITNLKNMLSVQQKKQIKKSQDKKDKMEAKKLTAIKLAQDNESTYKREYRQGDESLVKYLKFALTQYDSVLKILSTKDNEIEKQEIDQHRDAILEQISDHYFSLCDWHLVPLENNSKVLLLTSTEVRKCLSNANNMLEQASLALSELNTLTCKNRQKDRRAKHKISQNRIKSLSSIIEKKESQEKNSLKKIKNQEEIHKTFLTEKKAILKDLKKIIGPKALEYEASQEECKNLTKVDGFLNESEITRITSNVLTSIDSQMSESRQKSYSYHYETSHSSSVKVIEDRSPLNQTTLKSLVRFYLILDNNICHMHCSDIQRAKKLVLGNNTKPFPINYLSLRLKDACGINPNDPNANDHWGIICEKWSDNEESDLIDISSLFAMITAKELLQLPTRHTLCLRRSLFSSSDEYGDSSKEKKVTGERRNVRK